MTKLTHVQIHFVKGLINHRLLFGDPNEVIKLDRFRRLAVFGPHQILGYIRWKASQYGTVDWRLFVVKTGDEGRMTIVPGMSPAVKILISVSGRERMKRALPVMDGINASALNGFQSVPESYWQAVQSGLMSNSPIRELPRHYRKNELAHAQ